MGIFSLLRKAHRRRQRCGVLNNLNRSDLDSEYRNRFDMLMSRYQIALRHVPAKMRLQETRKEESKNRLSSCELATEARCYLNQY